MTEAFTYDKLNRLETICTNGVYNKMQYDAHGRILSKETDGEYVFNNAQYETTDSHGLAKPHAISSASMNGNLLVEASNIHYIHKDHLGSWTTITDAQGNIEQEQSFDAWGSFRDPYTWTGHFFMKPMFDRGFTGHEYLYGFDLINMNGRMYDPVLSSFLSVDSYVQDPDNSQNFNRYAYCLNNPLKYTDPSGEVAVVDDIIAAAIVGAIINGFVQTASGNVQNFGQWCLATVIGGAAGAAYNNSYESSMNDIFLKCKYKSFYSVEEGSYNINCITTRATARYGMTDDMETFVNLKNKKLVAGYVTQKGINGSELHLSPQYAKTIDIVRFKAVAGHELTHCFHHYKFGSLFNKTESEVSAYDVSICTLMEGHRFQEADDLIRIVKSKGYFRAVAPSYLSPFY